MPSSLGGMRGLLSSHPDGDRQFVGILSTITTYGLEAVASACAEALKMNRPSRDVVLSILSRTLDDADVPQICASACIPALTCEPLADCSQYDALLSGGEMNA